VLIVRLKQCDAAMSDGRLDEAFELARRPEVRGHRRGQELVGRLARLLVERGRSHLAGGHLLVAAQDCEKASQLDGNTADVAQLRSAISHAMAEQRRREHACQEVLATARRHAQMGQLSVGEQVLAAMPVGDDRAESIRRELGVRRASIQSVARKSKELLEAGDWEGAVEQIGTLEQGCRADPAVREVAARITSLVVGQATDAIEAGRLDLAASLMARHERLPGNWAEADQVRQALRQCRHALDCIEKADAAGAEQVLRAMARLWPKAHWIDSALVQAGQWRAAAEELRASPLRAGAGVTMQQKPNGAAVRPAPAPHNNGKSVDFVMHVDGVGGFRVVGRPAITLGPISASRPVDVPLLADASLPVITISRSDDDYFLQARTPVLVNDQPATVGAPQLLSSGDRITLGPRCRIVFRRPSAASNTAVLDLCGTRLPRGDVRHVILMDRELIVGPGPSVHVRADDLSAPAVLQGREGRLVCRAADPVLIDGRAASGWAELSPGAHVTIGSLGLVVAKEE